MMSSEARQEPRETRAQVSWPRSTPTLGAAANLSVRDSLDRSHRSHGGSDSRPAGLPMSVIDG